MTTHQDTSTERDTLIDAARQALGFLRRQEISYGDRVAGQYADKLSDAVHAALASRDEATGAEHDLVSNMRALEADHEPDGWPAVRMSTISHLCDVIERLRAALASRDEVAQQPQEQAVSDEEIDAALMEIDHAARDYEVYAYGLPLHLLDGTEYLDHKDIAEGMRQPIRAILALRDKPATAPDGTPNNAV